MQSPEKPWKWTEDGTLEVTAETGEIRTSKVKLGLQGQLETLRRDLELTRDVSATIGEAHTEFREGRADFRDAAARVKIILMEWRLALRAQLETAMGISEFLLTDTAVRDFNWNVDVLTEFAFEAIDTIKRLDLKAQLEAKRKAEEAEAILDPAPHEEPAPVAVEAIKTEE